MRLARNDEGFISVSQPHYADHMAKVFNLQSDKARTPLPPGTPVSKHERINFKEKTHHKLVESRVTPVQHKQKTRPNKHWLPTKRRREKKVQRSVMENVTTVPTESGEADALMGKNLTVPRRRGAIR